MTELYGAIEAGGTKFAVAVGRKNGEVVKHGTIKTTTPEETMAQVFDFFDQYQDDIISFGIGSFGPIGVNEKLENYGYITDTPKVAWQNYNFIGDMKARYDVPMLWTTDVNVAAYGEHILGAGQNFDNVFYTTIGTGVGSGVITRGEVYNGRAHPETGHLMMRKHPEDDFEGICPFHKDCLEGLACGPAIEARWGEKAFNLDQNHKAWEFEAYYLAQAALDFTLTFSPDIMIFGGGVSKQEHLMDMIRDEFAKMMNGYITLPDLKDYIVPVSLGDDAGIIGSLLLAEKVAR
ncbi:ROK family protein [Holzapfeliella sp. He02]|uniref:fructokinase n=1 Tax=Holzapfeliella saturejae TaxID=3082953 RepID=A0ABU8SEA7_9LACO